ncbi:hypothetical protein DPMN_093657 [Dreissena polymorpha]|uniref:BTB domain-containing protein n=1 Tax=Dreissena polymorpha TaxID=45954 RepID=A0A9D4R133_DREPO|nr:hypothetical protein DPMN_093657 [Dreissena polymorpha]
MFGQSSGFSDMTLVVENVRIPVIKATLMVTSPVFRAMLQADWKEKDQNEIHLPGKRLESFNIYFSVVFTPILRTELQQIMPQSFYHWHRNIKSSN